MGVLVVGGGVAGCAGALRLARHGRDVTLLEAGDTLGGLVTSLEVGGTPIERYYHHVFPQEHTIQRLIGELGLRDRFEFRPSRVGVLIGDRVWPFTTATDLLRFRPLPLSDRLRLGAGGMLMPRVADWTRLDRLPARRWVRRVTGPRAAATIWEPLLQAKFGAAAGRVPAAWLWGRFDQRAGARGWDGRERLGYLRGGFRQLFDALARELEAAGVTVRCGARVDDLRLGGDGAVEGARLADGGQLAADGVLWTASLHALAGILGDEHADPRWTAVGGLGVLSVVLELARPVTDHYWVNVCDPEVPYGALVEHTNFVPAADYGGRHVVYLARYFTHDEPLADADPEAEADRWVADLQARFPHVGDEDLLARHVSRAPYAAPLVTLGHLDRIPPTTTRVPGLHAAAMAQIYPHDRGMNDGMELAGEAADDLHAATDDGCPAPWRCPVCGGRGHEPWLTATADGGTECGVSAEAFRPSAEAYGAVVGRVVACRDCGHGSLADPVDADRLADAYAGAADPVSLRERPGRLETADRALDRVGAHLDPGRMLDVGCWTGAYVEAAARRGWRAAGLEPSTWASEAARERGLAVTTARLEDAEPPAAAHDLVVATDVLEHLVDPARAADRLHDLLRPGGVLFATVPDAGSLVARLLGERWWSVLPMHVQYFTRRTLGELLRRHGFHVLEMDSHPKVFSTRYYAERLSGYAPGLARAATGLLEATGLADRLVGPDLHDRVQVLARRRAR